MADDTAEVRSNTVIQSALHTIKRPLVFSLVIGLALRFVLAFTLTYEYDVYHWAVIMQNIDSGNGLYDLTGYFYLPVWGYIMGFIDMIWNSVLSIDVFGTSVTALFPITDLKNIWHLTTITTPAFNVAFKIPLILVDVVVGLVLHKMVLDMTGDRTKAEKAFALWFLCPIVFYMSGVQAMFDNISALMLILCLILVFREHYAFAGAMFAMAGILKLYPLACALVLVVYVFRRYDRQTAVRNLLVAAIGFAVCAVLVMLPNILQGNIASTLTFLTDRGSRNPFSVVPIILIVIAELFVMWYFSRTDAEKLDQNLIKYSICAIIISFMMGYNPQYFIVIIPLMIVYALVSEYWMVLMVWLIGSFSAVSACVQDNFSLLCSSVVYYGWLSPEWIVDAMKALETPIFGLSAVATVNDAISALTVASLVITVIVCFRSLIVRYLPKTAPFFDFIERKRGGHDA